MPNPRRPAAAALAALVVLAAAPRLAQPQVPAHPHPAIEERVDAIFQRWDSDATPGCAVAARLEGEPALARAYGMADLEHGIPNAPTTIFEAGSVAKQFTAAAIVLLALDGALSLDDDVRRFVPELPDYGATITIRHLLHHTSGLRDWGSVAALSGWGRSERTHDHDHVLDILSRQSALNYTPGEAYSYTNSGYNLLAIIVHRVSGQPFADFSRQRLFEPLGLADTRWRDDYRRIVPRRSAAYAIRDDEIIIDRPLEHVHGNGGLLTTVEDLLRWDRAMASGELGGPEFVRLMHQPGVLNDGRRISYAAGLQVGARHGVPEVRHTGATSGYRAFLGRYPDQDLAVALLCNVGAANPGALGEQVVDLLLEGRIPAPQPPPRRPTVDVTSAELQALTGLYRDARTDEPLRLVIDDDGLRSADGSRLLPRSPTVFDVGSTGTIFTFESAPVGHRPRIRVTTADADHPDLQVGAFEPVEPMEPNPDELAAFVGAFYSPDAETMVTILVDDGRLVMRRRPDARFPLTAVYPDVFRGPGIVRFHRDASGRVTELAIRQPRVHDMRFQRLPWP
jgi:CubicO group peptidase (beta-lactamase class C family)